MANNAGKVIAAAAAACSMVLPIPTDLILSEEELFLQQSVAESAKNQIEMKVKLLQIQALPRQFL